MRRSKGRLAVTFSEVKAAAEDIIEGSPQGPDVHLVDDEDPRERGRPRDPRAVRDPEAINFMAKHARGPICWR